MKTIKITNFKQYEQYLTTKNNIVFISGSSCAACIPTEENVKKVAKKFDLDVLKINQDEVEDDILTKLNIMNVPMIIIRRQNIELARVKGFQPEEILELYVQSKLEE